jgi:hypothetical protein
MATKTETVKTLAQWEEEVFIAANKLLTWCNQTEKLFRHGSLASFHSMVFDLSDWAGRIPTDVVRFHGEVNRLLGMADLCELMFPGCVELVDLHAKLNRASQAAKSMLFERLEASK